MVGACWRAANDPRWWKEISIGLGLYQWANVYLRHSDEPPEAQQARAFLWDIYARRHFFAWLWPFLIILVFVGVIKKIRNQRRPDHVRLIGDKIVPKATVRPYPSSDDFFNSLEILRKPAWQVLFVVIATIGAFACSYFVNKFVPTGMANP
jgi:hypothetical protein